MTYLKTALIASAMTAIASSTAFADDMDKTYKTEKAEWNETKAEMKTKAEDSPDSNMQNERKMLKAKHDHTVGEILQKDGEIHTKADYELLTHDGDTITKAEAKAWDSDNMIANNAIVAPSSSGAVTTVNCPIGTVAQPDFTCLVEGNFNLERTDNLLKEENRMKSEAAANLQMDRTEDMRSYSSETVEYKGTLRPDTVVVNNIDTDEKMDNWSN